MCVCAARVHDSLATVQEPRFDDQRQEYKHEHIEEHQSEQLQAQSAPEKPTRVRTRQIVHVHNSLTHAIIDVLILLLECSTRERCVDRTQLTYSIEQYRRFECHQR
jgi:hypothetical protein